MQEIFQSESPCPKCGCDEFLRLIGNHPGGHYARIQCAECDRFIKWESKPKEKKNPRDGVSKKLVKQYGRGYCECCLRSLDEIPPPQTLEGHHCIPVEHGGSDERSNIWILCTACHRLIHWQRTYLGHYGNEQDSQIA